LLVNRERTIDVIGYRSSTPRALEGAYDTYVPAIAILPIVRRRRCRL
jgi:hypothetical protein